MIDLEKVLERNYRKWKNKEHIYEKIEGEYRALTYGDFLDHAKGLAKYLLSLGLWNQSVMIYGNNSCNLMVADFAVLHYVGISVCVSKEWNETELGQAIRLLDISCVIYGEEKRDVISRLAKEFPLLTYISMASFSDIVSGAGDAKATGNAEAAGDAKATGNAEAAGDAKATGNAEAAGNVQCAGDAKNKGIAEKCIPREDRQCCKIVFSSGTTANPKAVMLSKVNIFAGLDSLYRRCPFHEGDVDYLFLPLSHTYGGIYNFLYSLVFGFSIYLCSDVSRMGREILEVNPTLFCGVPAIYRRFYESCGENIRQAFGNRIRYLFCGGASFDQNIRKAYKDSGLNMMEAYALSETASTFSIQYPWDPDIRSVGTIAEDIEVKLINEDVGGIGEIAVKGDNVFLGYAGDEKLTESAFTEDGYFRTGDLGYIEPDERNGGYKLYITGRRKRVLIGENGENFEPGHMEKLICEKNPYISKALVYLQDGKPGCHIWLSEPREQDWEAFFEELNAGFPAYQKIRQYDVVVDSMEKRLKQ